MINGLMNVYKKIPGSIQTWLRHWVIRPSKHLLSQGVIQQDGFVVAKRLNQSIPFKLWREGDYEPALSSLLRQHLKPGDVFFDIGANIGYFTLLGAACVGPTGQVHSFEPNPAPFKALQNNIQLNRFTHVTANAVALSDQPGTIKLWFNPEIDSGLASMGQNSTLLNQTIECPAVTLDHYIASHNITRVKAVKIDIEGAELLAFRGGHQWLTSSAAPELIALEAVAANAAALNFRLDMLAELLTDCGYQIYWLDETGSHSRQLVPIDDHQAQLPDGTWVAQKSLAE